MIREQPAPARRRRRSRREEGALARIEDEAGEPAAGEGPGVDADAVGANDRRLGNAVAMDDDLAEIDARLQKLVANPKQVLRLLTLERDARPDPGMNEGVVALDMHEREPIEEGEMLLRQLLGEFTLRAEQVLEIGIELRRAHAIAVERRRAAIGEPLRAGLRVGEEAHEAVLVIALQEDAGEPGQGLAQEEVDDAARMRAAIHIIAEINDDVAPGGVGCRMLAHPVEQGAQQLEASMDV